MFFRMRRYNKTLLGDGMEKFPAPLLMKTVHFTMQAILSKAITWFWSHRFQPNVIMSWRDYFMRGNYELQDMLLLPNVYLFNNINTYKLLSTHPSSFSSFSSFLTRLLIVVVHLTVFIFSNEILYLLVSNKVL